MRYTHMNICLKKADPAKRKFCSVFCSIPLFEESLHDQKYNKRRRII